MTQPSAKRPWRIIFACLILISGAALIATSPHFIKSGLQKYQNAFYTMLEYEKAKAGVCATDSHC